MFPTYNMNSTINKAMGTGDSLDPQAFRLFEKAYRRPMPGALQKLFLGAADPLPGLWEVVGQGHILNRYAAGAKTVELSQIMGTLNREIDFDTEFHPMQQHTELRWAKVATAMLRGVDLPPVELVQVGQCYFVKDGHHRISVARAMKAAYIDAVVEVWEVEAPKT